MDPASAGKKPVRVSILNQSYTLLAAGDPQEVVDLAQQVDELMASIAARAGHPDTTRVAVLTCLHLADRLRGIERELARLRQRVEQTSAQFSLLLEQASEDQP